MAALRNKDVAEKFQRGLQQRLEMSYPKDDCQTASVSNCWTSIRESLRQTAQEVLGYRNAKMTPWITEATLELAEARRNAKQLNDCTWSLSSMLKLKKLTYDMRASARRDKQVT